MLPPMRDSIVAPGCIPFTRDAGRGQPTANEDKMIKTTNALRPLHLSIHVATLALASQAHALTFQPSEDLSIDLDTTLSYSLAWRVE
ncbi:DUF1302 family protein, partial [Bowmanella yangjiangensis]|uniref:DUF1302 family protein n=1 Tax=Bowmanella yangjiangensis TaxID=2811230 RepID=UPI0039FBFC0A